MFVHMPPRERFGYAVLGVVVLFGMGALGARSLRQPAPVVVQNGLSASSQASRLVASTPSELVVHVAGAVRRPGVYRLKPNTRVYEALDLAGGARPDADLDRIDLAAKTVDGEQIYVPNRGEAKPVKSRSSTAKSSHKVEDPIRINPLAVQPPVVTDVEAHPEVEEPELSDDAQPNAMARLGETNPDSLVSRVQSRVNLNTASAEEIASLPGLGSKTAVAIVEYRRRHGRFMSIDELSKVAGIGPKRIAAIRRLVSL